MKDILKGIEVTDKMKVKTEETSAKDSDVCKFEKKNNLSSDTMPKEATVSEQKSSKKEENSANVVEKVVKQINKSDDGLDELTKKISGIELSSLEEDGKRKADNGLLARGPNGGVARSGSCEGHNQGFNFSQSQEQVYCSGSSKRGFMDDMEPAKYYKPSNIPSYDQINYNYRNDMRSQLNVQSSNHLNGGSVKINSPAVQTEHMDFPNIFDDLIDVEGTNFQNITTETNIIDSTFPVKEDNIYVEETSNNAYLMKPGPPSNQSDSGVSCMSYGSPYQENIPSPQNNNSNHSPPHVQEDPIAGREKEFDDVLDLIGKEILEDNQRKQRQAQQEMSKQAMLSQNIQQQPIKMKPQQQMPQQQMPPPHVQINQRIPVTLSNGVPMSAPSMMQQPQQPTMFGQNQIFMPQPNNMPTQVVHPINLNGNRIPVGPFTPFTQPQIIIIQQPSVVPNKKPLRNLAPKTDKVTNKKPSGSPGNGGILQKQQVPIVSVPPTQVQGSVPQQRPPPTPVNNTKKQLNVCRRMVAEIPTEQLKIQDDDGDTYLHVAACKNEPNLIQALLERLIREQMDWLIDLENKNRMTPLYLAVLNNQPEMVEIFLKNNADPNSLAQSNSSAEGKSKEVKAPIHVAAAGGDEYLQTLRKLLAVKDISLNIYNSEGHTALHTAIISHGTKRPNGTYINSMNAIEALIKAGADPNSQDKKSGKTPLMYAIEKRDYMLIEKMLRLFDPKKLRNVIKSQTFDGSNCLRIAEGRKSEFNPQDWQKLWDLLNKACTGELPRPLQVY